MIYRFAATASVSGCGQRLGIERCPYCGLANLRPRPTEETMQQIYGAVDYYEGRGIAGYESYADQEPYLRRTFRLFLGELQKRGLTGGALADIGCGPGLLLDEARPFFSFRMGTDLCAEVAAKTSLLSDGTVCGGPAILAASGSRFDLVTAVGVLEHVYDAVAFLTSCRNLLRRGGAVVVATPDMNSFWRRAMGKRWPSFKLPEHIAYYDRWTLDALGRRSGMQAVEIFSYDHYFSLSLILKKLGFDLNGLKPLRNLSVLLPGVMVAGVFRGTAQAQLAADNG